MHLSTYDQSQALTCCVLLQANVEGQLVSGRPGGGQTAQVLKDTEEQQVSRLGYSPTPRNSDLLWYQSAIWTLLGKVLVFPVRGTAHAGPPRSSDMQA